MPGYLWPAAIYALILGLHLAVPTRWVDGYILDPLTGARRRYRINGLAVGAIVLALWEIACRRGWMAWDALWTARWESLAGACVIGLVFTLAVVLPAPRRGGLLSDLYLGRVADPRWFGGRVDAKMALYLVGAVMLELNVLSFAAHHRIVHPADPSPGVMLSAAMLSFFVIDYLYFERVHLYTWDLVAERVGFKLGWGCTVFYPYFYGIGLWAVADEPNPHAPGWLLAAGVLVFLAGWMLARGANMQKYRFKVAPQETFLGLIEPVALGADSPHVLCSGFWGWSRHINYLGEILMATGITLALGFPQALLPWLYPLYYVALLVPRQIADDARCAARYGATWQEYCRRVPYRIVPGIY